MDAEQIRILRFPEVVSRTGLSRSSVYGRIKAGDFPSPVQLGPGRAVGFIEQEVANWIALLGEHRKGELSEHYARAREGMLDRQAEVQAA